MSLLGFFILVVFSAVVGSLSRKAPKVKTSWRVQVCIGALLLCLVASSLVALVVSDFFGVRVEDPRAFYGFVWVGISASLPISLLVARAFGGNTYAEYWEYLTARPKMTRRRFVIFWSAMCILLFAFGMAVLLLGVPWAKATSV